MRGETVAWVRGRNYRYRPDSGRKNGRASWRGGGRADGAETGRANHRDCNLEEREGEGWEPMKERLMRRLHRSYDTYRYSKFDTMENALPLRFTCCKTTFSTVFATFINAKLKYSWRHASETVSAINAVRFSYRESPNYATNPLPCALPIARLFVALREALRKPAWRP